MTTVYRFGGGSMKKYNIKLYNANYMYMTPTIIPILVNIPPPPPPRYVTDNKSVILVMAELITSLSSHVDVMEKHIFLQPKKKATVFIDTL